MKYKVWFSPELVYHSAILLIFTHKTVASSSRIILWKTATYSSIGKCKYFNEKLWQPYNEGRFNSPVFTRKAIKRSHKWQTRLIKLFSVP